MSGRRMPASARPDRPSSATGAADPQRSAKCPAAGTCVGRQSCDHRPRRRGAEDWAPVVLAGDDNVMPDDLNTYKPERWPDDALFRPEIRDLHPDERINTLWDYFRNA